MIKITMELCPGGFDNEAWNERLSTIVIANDMSGTMSKGNYTYEIYRRGDEKLGKPLRKGHIIGFSRNAKTVNHLMFLVLKDAGFNV